jgi:diaminopimelate epimerase
MIPFAKYHGTGNEFLIVDAASQAIPDRGAFAAAACDPAVVGADGVLFLRVEEREAPTRVIMRLYQPDGGTAAMCGNGARCAARWASERTGATELVLDTPAGARPAMVRGEDVAIRMGVPAFAPQAVPVAGDGPVEDRPLGGYAVTAVNTGVPHAVAFVSDVGDVDLDRDAPAIRHADVFPEGANATFASRDGDGYRQRTFERGVEGETASCGTGAVAVAAVARRRGEVDAGETVRVSPPGGDLGVRLAADGEAVLSGPVTHEFDGELPAEPEAPET